MRLDQSGRKMGETNRRRERDQQTRQAVQAMARDPGSHSDEKPLEGFYTRNKNDLNYFLET